MKKYKPKKWKEPITYEPCSPDCDLCGGELYKQLIKASLGDPLDPYAKSGRSPALPPSSGGKIGMSNFQDPFLLFFILMLVSIFAGFVWSILK